MIDEALKEWATARQAELIDAANQHGGVKPAARALGIGEGTIRSAIEGAKKKAAAHGYSPEHNLRHIIPAPFIAKGHSTYYDRDGKPTQQWVKSKIDDQKWLELLTNAAAEMSADLPRIAPTERPGLGQQAAVLCNQYTLTDAHMGALAWHEEGGANWDVKIAEAVLMDCFMSMLDRAPPARVGVVAQLGDWFHSDGLVPVTPASGHVLDQDGRYAKIVRAGIRVLRRVTQEALARHEKVILLLAEGNHDPAGSVWLQAMFAAIYENEPRVEVIQTPLPYYALQHGRTALFYHHGHKKKVESLPLLFASLFPQIWGGTVKRYAHTGHLHHLAEKEHPGLKLTQHPTLAARDAYAARGGFLSERQASAITYHEEYGEVARLVVTPEMVEKG